MLSFIVRVTPGMLVLKCRGGGVKAERLTKIRLTTELLASTGGTLVSRLVWFYRYLTLAGLSTPRLSKVMKLVLRLFMLMVTRGMDRYVLIIMTVLIVRVTRVTCVTGPTALSMPDRRAMVMTWACLATRLGLRLRCLLLAILNYCRAVLACPVIRRYGMRPVRRLTLATRTLLLGCRAK